MHISRRITAVVVVVLVGIALWAALSGRSNGNNTVVAHPPENEPLPAAVATVRIQPAETSITIPGVFQAYQDVLIHAKVSGYIQKIFVDIGDHVRKGEILAILEVPELNAQVEAAQAAVSRDRLEIQRTRHDVDRAKAIHAALHSEYDRLKDAAAKLPGLIAQQDLDDKQAQDLSSEAQIDAAESASAAAQEKANEDEATLNHFKALQAYSRVRAPFNGIVTFRYADTGSLISAGTGESKNAMPIVRLAQSEVLRLRMPVPASAVNYMRVGGSAIVHVQNTGEILHTRITRFTRSLSGSTRTMLTEVDIPNKDLHLSPGMYASTTFPLKHTREAMIVPIDAIAQGDQPYVLTVDKTNYVVKSPVALGIQGPNYYQVVSGIHVGDKVIVGNLSEYQPGQLVTPSPVDTSLTTFKQTSSQPQNLRATSSPVAANGGPR